MTGLALGGWIVGRRALLGYVAAALGAAGAFCLVTAQVWATEVAAQPAVIVVAEVSASSGPSEEAKQILLLHDGTEVRIRETRGDYCLAQVPGGAGGWVPKSSLERVYQESGAPSSDARPGI